MNALGVVLELFQSLEFLTSYVSRDNCKLKISMKVYKNLYQLLQSSTLKQKYKNLIQRKCMDKIWYSFLECKELLF